MSRHACCVIAEPIDLGDPLPGLKRFEDKVVEGLDQGYTCVGGPVWLYSCLLQEMIRVVYEPAAVPRDGHGRRVDPAPAD
jgi:hypothetical protein